MEPVVSITMTEWQTLNPDAGTGLEGRALAGPEERTLARELAKAGMIEIVELRTGLSIRSFSFVGHVRIGSLEITVLPKIKQSSLLNLLRYAFGFRRLALLPDAMQKLDKSGFADLLVSQLNAEASDLISRGLHRTYIAQRDWLSVPTGRIDIQRLANAGGIVTASLPCTHHPRIEDNLLNRVLLAGLHLGARVATDLQVRRDSRRLGGMLEEEVSPTRLDVSVLDRSERALNRLTVAYEPVMTLIRLLWESLGITLGETDFSLQLPGFLFDMNRFFQALLSRFLRDNLPDYAIRDEFRLRGMMQFVPGYKLPNQRAPVPRPDFVILHTNKLVEILDAKYRDIWERNLPQHMLYQLAIYATSHAKQSATILYPTTHADAKEARIRVQDPLLGRQIGQVNLRPVLMPLLEDLVMSGHSASAQRSRRTYAESLALGTKG